MIMIAILKYIKQIETTILGVMDIWQAEQLGKEQTTISKWCTNSSQPDLGNIMQIAKILDVELTDLVRF